MAVVYDKRDINIEYFSKFNLDENKYNKQLVIYPVLSYKVYAPVLEDMKLNVFQKNILFILNKGNYSVDEISKWLNLDRLLVQTILAELSNLGYYDGSKNIITSKGKNLIEEKFSWFDNAENMREDIRYIYQDIYTHKTYPLLMPMNNNSKNLYLKAHKFHYKTVGEYDTFDYVQVQPKINFNRILKPNNDEVFDAINEHIKLYTSTPNDLQEKPSAIQFLDNEPKLVYLAVWVYIDKNSDDIEEFEVIDPFSIYDDAFWMKEGIEIGANNLLESLVVDKKMEEGKKITGVLKELQNEVAKDINEKFHYLLKEHTSIYKSLLEFYFDLKLYEYHQSGKYLKDAFRQSQIVLETLFHHIYDEYQFGYKEVLNIDKKLNNLSILEVESKIKSINNLSEIPNWTFSKFSPHIIKPALTKPNKASLRALYVGATLAAWYDNSNPMFNLITQKNNLLVFFEKIAEGRNNVGHKYCDIEEKEIAQYSNEVTEASKGIEEIITIFLEGDR